MRMPMAWIILVAAFLSAPASAASPTLEQFLAYPFVSDLVSAPDGGRIAWVENVNGVRNIWTAAAPQFSALQLTHYAADDGQELTQLNFDRAGSTLVYVRGGDHDANWEAEGNLAPDPAADPAQQKVAIWAVPVSGGTPTMLAEGDEPAISSTGQVAYIDKDQVWTVPLNASAKPQQLLFDRGKDRAPLGRPMAAGSPSLPRAAITPSSRSMPGRMRRLCIWRLPPAATPIRSGRRTATASPSRASLATAAHPSRS